VISQIVTHGPIWTRLALVQDHLDLLGDDAGGRAVYDQLGPREQAEYARYTHPARRRVWRLGRIMCRELLREAAGDTLDAVASIEILSRDDHDDHVRPTVFLRGEQEPQLATHLNSLPLSIAHFNDAVCVALSTDPQLGVGVDLVEATELGDGFQQTWFSPDERQLVAEGDSSTAVTLWAVKEAVYKAVNNGEQFRPKEIEVQRDATGRYRCSVRGHQWGERCTIDVHHRGAQIIVLATAQLDPPRPASRDDSFTNRTPALATTAE